MADVNLTPLTTVPDGAVVLGGRRAFTAADDTEDEVAAQFVQIPVASLRGEVVAPETLTFNNTILGHVNTEAVLPVNVSATAVATLVTARTATTITLRAGSYILSVEYTATANNWRFSPQFALYAGTTEIATADGDYWRAPSNDPGAVNRPTTQRLSFYLTSDTEVQLRVRQYQYTSGGNVTGQGGTVSSVTALVQPVGGVKGDPGSGGAPAAYVASAADAGRILTLTDQDGGTVTVPYNLVPAWAAGIWAVGELARHGGIVYQCTTARVAGNTSNPASDTSSWSALGDGGGTAPTLANVTAALGLPAEATANRGYYVARNAGDDNGYTLVVAPIGGAGITVTRLNPNVTDDDTQNSRPARTVFKSVREAQARNALRALTGSDGDIAYYLVYRSATENTIRWYRRHSSQWLFVSAVAVSINRATSTIYYSGAPGADLPSEGIAYDALYRTTAALPISESLLLDRGGPQTFDILEPAPFGQAVVAGDLLWLEIEAVIPANVTAPLLRWEGAGNEVLDGGETELLAGRHRYVLPAATGSADGSRVYGIAARDNGQDSTLKTTVHNVILFRGSNLGAVSAAEIALDLAEDKQFAPETLYDAEVALVSNQRWTEVQLDGRFEWDDYDAIHIRFALREDPLLAQTYLRSDFERLATQTADGTARWYDGTEETALFLVDQGGTGAAIGISTDRRKLLFAHSDNAVPPPAAMQILGIRYGGLKGDKGDAGDGVSTLEPANLKAAYFPEHQTMLALPDAAGAYEVEILDPVSLSETLIDGDQFIVHGYANTPPTGVTMNLQIRGRYDNTVTTDEVPIVARQFFTKLTLDTPGAAEDTVWKLYLRGTKPATTGATIGYTLREIIGVQGGTQPFAGAVAQMIEDLLHYRLLLNYGIFRHETDHLYSQGTVVLDPFDNNLYRFLPSFEHSTNVPSENPTQWARMTFPGPLAWAREGNTDVIPSSKLPNAATGAEIDARILEWARTGNTDVIPSSKLPALADPVTAADIDARILAWARTGSTAPVPNGKLSLGLAIRYLVNPVDPADGRDRSVEIVAAGETTRLYGATAERAGLMTAADRVNLAALLSGRRFNWRGEWSAEATYQRDDVVHYNDDALGHPADGLFVANQESTGSHPNYPLQTDTNWDTLIYALNYTPGPMAAAIAALTGDARLPYSALKDKPTIPTPTTPAGAWTNDVAYSPRDVVYDYNAEAGVTVLAEARVTHVATLTNRPAGIDADSAEWYVLEVIRQSQHARTTAALDERIRSVAPTQPVIPGPSDWWRGAWVSTNSYSAGEIVGYQNAWFKAGVDVATGGGNPGADTARWTEIMRLELDLTSAGRLRYRLDFGAQVGGQDTSWDDVPLGVMVWRGEWTHGTSYTPENIVTRGGYMWLCTGTHTASATGSTYNGPGSSEARWLRFGPYVPEASQATAMVWYGAWVTNVAFPEGWVVTRSSHTYVATRDVPAGIEPDGAMDNNHWDRLL